MFGTACILALATDMELEPLPESLDPSGEIRKPRLMARDGQPMTITYVNAWNIHDRAPLHDIPLLLQQAFILAEDQRYYRHRGVDWMARLHALWQNARAGRLVRGASTISEQVVRMLHPRPRTLWSRWLEGIEAESLERHFSKSEILEFYLNQVPYSAQRRGIVQGARYYFDRSLHTLSTEEMLALAALVRAPSRLDPHRHRAALEPAIERLASSLYRQGLLAPDLLHSLHPQALEVASPRREEIDAGHFARFVSSRHDGDGVPELTTTLDRTIQVTIQQILDQRLRDLGPHLVTNGAALVVDHRHNEILAWVVGGGFSDHSGASIDAITTPRQPGSTLKPFLYALALERGWTAVTMIDDSPLSESVGFGLHTYRNYSRGHYGPVSLREALGNSLNIPAVRTLQHIGPGIFLDLLRDLGFVSLRAHPEVYGDGLALGNGEVTLYELVQAYTVLARRGLFLPLTSRLGDPAARREHRVYSQEASSLIADILADPQARRLEFGDGGLLRFAVETAVKTGTSSDYRDAWALGFNHRYTVGVWMGNLDRRSMDEVSGSVGPTLVLRGIFAELNRRTQTKALYRSPRLVQREICAEMGLTASAPCSRRSEWFLPGTEVDQSHPQAQQVRIRHPSNGLQLARDPRIPDEHEMFRFALTENEYAWVQWHLDGVRIASGVEPFFLWPLQEGPHRLSARVGLKHTHAPLETEPVRFLVK